MAPSIRKPKGTRDFLPEDLRVSLEVEETFRRLNYRTEVKNGTAQGFFHGTGHGVGLDIHEDPFLGAVSAKIPTGSVITIEPGLYYPNLGGIRIEDTVVVTKTGWEYLATCPKKFMV